MTDLKLVHSYPDCLEIIRSTIGASCSLEQYDPDSESAAFAFKLLSDDENVIADVIKYNDGVYAVTVNSVTSEVSLPVAIKILRDCKIISSLNSPEYKRWTRFSKNLTYKNRMSC